MLRRAQQHALMREAACQVDRGQLLLLLLQQQRTSAWREEGSRLEAARVCGWLRRRALPEALHDYDQVG